MSLITATKEEREYIKMCREHFKLYNYNTPTTDTAMNTLVVNLKNKKVVLDASNKLLNDNTLKILTSTWR
jgi:hypothetical protein